MVVPLKNAGTGTWGQPGPLVYAIGLLAWYALALLGLQYLLLPAHVTLIWFSSGITIGLLLITPTPRRIPLLALTGILHATVNAFAGHSLTGAVIIAAAYTCEAWVVVFVYERLMEGESSPLASIRSVLVFSLAAAIGTPAVTGLGGALVCHLAYGPVDISEAWFIWSVTDALGIILFAPLVVVWARWRPSELRAGGVRPVAIAIVQFAVLAVGLEILIGSHIPVPLPVFSRAYLAFPIVFLWTYRYGMKGVTVVLLPVAAVMLWNALDGPWSMIWPSAAFPRVVTVQLFVVVLAMSGLAFAALLRERANTLERLRLSADHQRDLARRLEVQVERIPLGLIVLDRSGMVREWNPAAEVIFGFSSREATGLALPDRMIPSDRRHAFVRLLDEAASSDRSVRTITPALRKDGTQVQVEWNATPLRGDMGRLTGILATAQDVTERGRSEKKIQRLNRLYAFLSQINQAIVRARSREELFESICAVAVEYGKFRFAWIGELTNGGARLVPLASAGEGTSYLDAMRAAMLQGPHPQRPPVMLALQSGQVETIQRATTDPRLSLWHGQVMTCGFGSGAVLPLATGGSFNGCLEVFATENEYFDAEELAVLQEIRGDILFALSHLALDGHVRMARQALQESETRFRSIVESIDDLVFTLDAEQRHTGAYGGEFTRSGIDAATLLGRTPAEVFGPEGAAIHIEHNLLALQGRTVHYDWTVGEGAERKIFSTKLSPQIDANGTVVGITGVARDISWRIRMEEELRSSREMFSTLFHGSPVPTSLIRVSTRHIVDVNRAFEEWTGYTREEVKDHSPAEFGLFADEEQHMHAVTELLAKGQLSGAEVETRMRTGEHRIVEVYATLVMLGEEQFLITKVLDVTDKKKAEEDLRQERALLARRVEERTSELREANAALAKASRLKDEFLASMSHELRTPLTGILGMAEALQMQVYGALNERQGKAVRTIDESGHHLLALINDILDLSRIEAGKLELQEDAVVVRDLCETTLTLVRPAATRKHQHLALVYDECVRTMKADTRRVKQVLVNLLGNAIKFTPDGGAVTLEVRGDTERSRVTFACKDTGIGIASADLPGLFQPFVQVDSRLSREYGGSGLGLSLAHRIVELHGGAIEVDSTPGQGSVFTVILPWRDAGSAPGRPGAGISDEPAHGSIAGESRPLLLIADDNETTLSLYAEYFQECGYEVALARHGAEAIRSAGEHPPAVVLMDVQMPGIDGLAAIRMIRESERRDGRPPVPVIALTALTMPGDRERCLEAGADRYISKPVQLRALEILVQELIGDGERT